MFVIPLLPERVNDRTSANWRKLVQALYDSPTSERKYRYLCLADGYLLALNNAELIDDVQYQSLYIFLQKM